jgi:hypothetical protein
MKFDNKIIAFIDLEFGTPYGLPDKFKIAYEIGIVIYDYPNQKYITCINKQIKMDFPLIVAKSIQNKGKTQKESFLRMVDGATKTEYDGNFVLNSTDTRILKNKFFYNMKFVGKFIDDNLKDKNIDFVVFYNEKKDLQIINRAYSVYKNNPKFEFKTIDVFREIQKMGISPSLSFLYNKLSDNKMEMHKAINDAEATKVVFDNFYTSSEVFYNKVFVKKTL